MIVGTGVDMVEVARVAEKLERKGFRDMVFSKAEIAYCENGTLKAEHYAARFAAKEAFLKATGHGLLAGHDLFLIEIALDDMGKPSLILHGAFHEMAQRLQWNKIHVSLSHTRDLACAFVIIEK
jgi:holo-[acyl-carrier protein] synthase